MLSPRKSSWGQIEQRSREQLDARPLPDARHRHIEASKIQFQVFGSRLRADENDQLDEGLAFDTHIVSFAVQFAWHRLHHIRAPAV